MRTLKQASLLFILFLLAGLSSEGQSNDDCKYLMVLTYLRTNVKANQEIKTVFSRMKVARKNDRFVEFNLSDRIDFLGIDLFKKQLDSTNFGISQEFINDPYKYYEKYFFKSFRSDFLKRTMERNDSKLFLTFSKPVNNLLIAELGYTRPEVKEIRKFGLAIQFLFKFDSTGQIENVLYASTAYN